MHSLLNIFDASTLVIVVCATLGALLFRRARKPRRRSPRRIHLARAATHPRAAERPIRITRL